MTASRQPDFSARKVYVPARPAERTKAPAVFVFVSTFVELPFSSRSTVATATGLPAVSRIVPWTVAASDSWGAGSCSNATALEKLISVAAITPRTVPVRFRVLRHERCTACLHFIIETKFPSLRATQHLFFILPVILSPAIVARNESRLTSACGKLRPHVRSQLCEGNSK